MWASIWSSSPPITTSWLTADPPKALREGACALPIDSPPQPPAVVERSGERSDALIVDMREAFERKTPQTAQDEARMRAFIEGKIEIIRRDPSLTDEQRAAAIETLKALHPRVRRQMGNRGRSALQGVCRSRST
jgi:hypothetical protein